MTNAYELRNHFFLEDYNTAITREDFESFFTKTKEKVTFTFGGWDGKSYDGESRRATVYRTTVKGYEDVRLIKVGKGLQHRRGHRGFGEGHRRIPQESQLAGGRQKEVRKHAKTNNAECSPYRAVSRTGSRAKIGSGYFYALENIMKFKIDRTELPYDAMVADPSWLIPYEEEGETTDDEETEELQTDTVHGEGLPLR